jgi:hypothetical protein
MAAGECRNPGAVALVRFCSNGVASEAFSDNHSCQGLSRGERHRLGYVFRLVARHSGNARMAHALPTVSAPIRCK